MFQVVDVRLTPFRRFQPRRGKRSTLDASRALVTSGSRRSTVVGRHSPPSSLFLNRRRDLRDRVGGHIERVHVDQDDGKLDRRELVVARAHNDVEIVAHLKVLVALDGRVSAGELQRAGASIRNAWCDAILSEAPRLDHILGDDAALDVVKEPCLTRRHFYGGRRGVPVAQHNPL